MFASSGGLRNDVIESLGIVEITSLTHGIISIAFKFAVQLEQIARLPPTMRRLRDD
jgi:hypothetical protein